MIIELARLQSKFLFSNVKWRLVSVKAEFPFHIWKIIVQVLPLLSSAKFMAYILLISPDIQTWETLKWNTHTLSEKLQIGKFLFVKCKNSTTKILPDWITISLRTGSVVCTVFQGTNANLIS